MSSNVAIFWDLENVTPSSSNTLFIEGLMEYAESIGRVITSYAYAEWSKPAFRRLGPALASKHFYMVHVPRERKGKNSADMQLVADALELVRFHDHIDTFILITGDSDFRPLLQSLRRAGKIINIICDIKTAAHDLLQVADSFTDYRDLMPGGDEDEDDTPTQQPVHTRKADRKYWYEIMAETVDILKRENKNTSLGSVKVKLKMLNPQFNEKNLNFKRWSDFVSAAVNTGYVSLEEEDGQTRIDTKTTNSGGKEGSLQSALKNLMEILDQLNASDKEEFHSYSMINGMLRDRGFDIRNLGFSQFKKFMQSAEARGLIESKIENFHYYARKNQ